jgi:O-antigen/teichoic acid export membrane protein
VLLILLSGYISLILFSSDRFELILQVAFANVFFLVINPIIFSTLRIQHKAVKFSVIRIVQFTINLVLNIVFIVFLNWGLLAIFVSQLISQVLIFLYFLPMYLHLTTFRLNLKLIREFLIFSLPLIPVGFFQLINSMINRYFLEYYDTLESVGLFSFAFRISNTVKILIIESLSLSLTPILYQKLAQKDGRRFVQKNYIYAIFITIFVYILIASFSREIIILIARSEEYYASYSLIPLLTFAYVFQAMVYFYHVLLTYGKKTTSILNATIFTAVITVGLNFLLIPEFKIYGAAAISILSSLILFLFMSYYARHNWKAFFETRKIILMIICGITIVLINQFVLVESGLLYIVIKLLVCLSFPFILYPFKFYEQVELERIRYTISVILKKLRGVK